MNSKRINETKKEELLYALDKLEKFEKVSVRSLMLRILENDDFFAQRNFNNLYSQAKKMLPEKSFMRQAGFIVRTN